MSLLLNRRCGLAESIELVLVSAHTPMRFSLAAVLPVSDPSPSVELRKNSVPPLAFDACPAGEMAGHTVKLRNGPSAGPSKDTIFGVVAPSMRSTLENA